MSLGIEASASSRRQWLRERASSGKAILVPGVSDALAARIFVRAGAEAVIVGGYAAAATGFGLPDIGLLTMSEMAKHIKQIADSIDVPVLADADTGYGEAVNIIRTVREFEAAGAAAILIEDQESPKRCGHMSGKTLIAGDAMVEKISAALMARRDPGTVIVARTDAIGTTSLEDAVRRCQLYAAAGADWIFPDAPRSVQEMRQLRAAVDVPVVADMVEGSVTPSLELSELESLGWTVVTYPASGLRAAAAAVEAVAITLMRDGTTRRVQDRLMPVDHLHDILQLDAWRQSEEAILRQSHLSSDKTAASFGPLDV